MKKILLTVLFWLLAPTGFAQSATQLESQLYQDLETWEIQGYIRQLPQLKPYSGIILDSLLKEADQKGTLGVKDKVRLYRSSYLPKLGMPHWEFQHQSLTSGDAYLGLSQLSLQEKGLLTDYVSVDAALTGQLIQGTESSGSGSVKKATAAMSPMGQSLDYDYFVDKTQATFKGLSTAATATYSSLFGVGNETFSGQFGYTRTSFFELEGDALAVSPQAYKAPHFSFTWKTDATVFSSLFMCLTATNWKGGDDQYTNKYLNLSSFQWKINPVVELTYYDSVIYGQRIAPEYFLPGMKMMHAQDDGNVDNIFMGWAARFFLPGNVRVVTNVYLDDFTIMKFLAGSYNTRFKAAFDLNAKWSPENSFLRSLSLGYTAVMPYTYTHNPEFIDDPNNTNEYAVVKNGGNEPNYSDATHMGAPLGTVIGPNSDRVQLKAEFFGPWNSQLSAKLAFFRHGNASEGASWDTSKYVTAGSIFDSGYDTSGQYGNLFESVKFLDQTVIEQILQFGLGGKIPFDYTGGTLTPSVNLTGEWYWNHNLIAGNNGFKPYLNMGLDWQF